MKALIVSTFVDHVGIRDIDSQSVMVERPVSFHPHRLGFTFCKGERYDRICE